MQRISRMLPKVILNATAIFLSVLFLQLPNPAAAQELRVLTWNLYLGAEIQSLAAAQSSDEFFAGVQEALGQIAANNFPDRAAALAAAIIEKDPHVVALQEVYNFTINGQNAQPPFRDYLDDLLAALEAQGAYYDVAATVENLNLSLPFGPVEVGVIDRDVILAREDIQTQVVDLSAFCPGRASVDGCNYAVVAGISIPGVGLIEFKRGYVAVDILSGAPPVRFFDTHLEVRDPQPGNLLSPLVQRAQAIELTAVLKSVALSDDMPLIIAGDINSSIEDTDLLFGFYPSPYMQLTQNNYDIWTLRPGKPAGYTCCLAEDLSMAADLYERIDVIFSNQLPAQVKASVVGNDEADRTSSDLWPSDHAGVAARMAF